MARPVRRELALLLLCICGGASYLRAQQCPPAKVEEDRFSGKTTIYTKLKLPPLGELSANLYVDTKGCDAPGV